MKQRLVPTASLVMRYQGILPTASLMIEGIAPVNDGVGNWWGVGVLLPNVALQRAIDRFSAG